MQLAIEVADVLRQLLTLRLALRQVVAQRCVLDGLLVVLVAQEGARRGARDRPEWPGGGGADDQSGKHTDVLLLRRGGVGARTILGVNRQRRHAGGGQSESESGASQLGRIHELAPRVV